MLEIFVFFVFVILVLYAGRQTEKEVYSDVPFVAEIKPRKRFNVRGLTGDFEGVFLLNHVDALGRRYYFFANYVTAHGLQGFAYAKHTGRKNGHWDLVYTEFETDGMLKNNPSRLKTRYEPVPFTKIVRELSALEVQKLFQ